MIKSTLLSCLLASFSFFNLHAGTLYIYGDSHASCFCQIPHAQVLYGGSKTMHRVGHDPFDLSSIPIKNGDAVLYSFGQIDIGWHLGKQIDTCGKDLDEILETLAVNYLNSIKITTQNHPDLLKVVYSILPPSPDSGLSIPYAGTIELRAEATKILNANLRLLCPKYGFEFLDVYDDFSDADGILNPEIRDDVSFFHIALEYYDFVNQRFFEIYNRI